MYFHQLMILGRATTDVEVKKSKAKNSYAKFGVAVNVRRKEDKEETYFYDVLFFGKRAEKASELIKKGDTLLIFGEPDYDAYNSKKDKKAKAVVTLIAESWRLVKK
ncbi:single-stranded DNA-binding protein [Candidatus Dojkabacteria bacterium]|nr:single-stranded DNA-binding protein [Candidatus Dojkabacteria bacterium]